MDLGKFAAALPFYDGAHDLFRRHHIDLVEEQKDRRFDLGELVEDELLAAAKWHGSIDDVVDHIAVVNGRGRRFLHVLVETVLRLVDTWRIDKDHLRIRRCENAGDAGAGGLRLGGNDGDLAFKDLIEQGALTSVWPADQRDKTGFHNASSFFW